MYELINMNKNVGFGMFCRYVVVINGYLLVLVFLEFYIVV